LQVCLFLHSLPHPLLALCAVNLALTTFTFALPWWVIKCYDNCDGHLYTVELDIGVCSVGKIGGFSESNCIRWDDSQQWDDIDLTFGTNTAHAAHFIYPRVYKLTLTSLSISLLQFLICVISLFKPGPFPIILYQILVIFFATTYQVLVTLAQSLGSNNSITDGSTWQDYTSCSKSYDSPYYAYWTFAATQTLTFLMLFLVISPNRCTCFHLVAFDDTTDEIDAVTVSQDTRSISVSASYGPPPLVRKSPQTHADHDAEADSAIYESGIEYRLSLVMKAEDTFTTSDHHLGTDNMNV
jgi:hypothetical protein